MGVGAIAPSRLPLHFIPLPLLPELLPLLQTLAENHWAMLLRSRHAVSHRWNRALHLGVPGHCHQVVSDLRTSFNSTGSSAVHCGVCAVLQGIPRIRCAPTAGAEKRDRRSGHQNLEATSRRAVDTGRTGCLRGLQKSGCPSFEWVSELSNFSFFLGESAVTPTSNVFLLLQRRWNPVTSRCLVYFRLHHENSTFCNKSTTVLKTCCFYERFKHTAITQVRTR